MSALEAAWSLTRTLVRTTRRRTVRAAARDAGGEFVNEYPIAHQLHHGAPDGPWAMYLAEPEGGFRYLCFDLDAKGGNPVRDTQRLTRWLDELAIAHLVCVSGPSGGRHVWIALTAAADPDQVSTLARRAKLLLPSLDLSPLSNPARGCVRPPGAPHRAGGISEPLGEVSVLLSPSTTPAQLAQLDALLEDAGLELPAVETAPLRGMDADSDGHPRLKGARRGLSSRIRSMLEQPPLAENASYTMRQIFVATANARWSFEDVLQLARTAPALEHARTQRGARGRVPRTEAGFCRAVSYVWAGAVQFAAANPAEHTPGADEDYPEREKAVLAALGRLQEAAAATPGLWGQDRASRAQRAARGSASRRAVLDALTLYMAQAVRLDVEADIRRLAKDTGYGRTAVWTALRALSAPTVDGEPESAWIVRTADPEVPHGARYRLSERFSTGNHDPKRTQVLAPPPTVVPPRDVLVRELGARLASLAHDVFSSPRSLGRSAGILYTLLPKGSSATVDELAPRAGMSGARTRRLLHRLHTHGLARIDSGRWRAGAADRDQVAEALGVAGYLEARGIRYDLERQVWAWWQAEITWMQKPHTAKRGSRPAATALPLVGADRPGTNRYPRGPDRRGDHKTAAQLVRRKREPAEPA
jgi:hypothetical protein